MSFRTKGTVGPVYRPEGEPIDIKPSLDVTKAEDAILASKKQPVPSHAISNKITFPKRPTYGTAGRRITLRTNYFHLIPTAGQRVYRYVVQFDPEAATSRKERRLFNLLFGNPIFAAVKESVATDYRSIVISPEELPLDADARKFVITYYDADEATPRANAAKHTASIQITGALDVADMMQYLNSTARDASYDRLEEMTQALNIVIARHANTTLGTVSLSGNKFFPTTGGLEEFIDLSGGVIAIRGYYTSVRTATLRVLLNLNVCTSAFYQSTQLSDLMMKQWNICGRKWDGVESFIKKLRVETTYLKDKSGQIVRKFKNVSGFAQPPQNAFATLREVKFDSEYGAISVAAFFKESEYVYCLIYLQLTPEPEHGIILQNPDVPAVNVGTKERPCYLPPELCLVSAGQVMKKRLSENQTNIMMKFANRSPPDNARQIVGTGLKVVGIQEGGGDALVSRPLVAVVG
ncbi:MAG: hypothetical protein M1839_006868 [Geoglossum umbratile]|nr:MAG: hypothetical protein M1839_006868 [Geoglossum umbratile]